MSRPEDVLELHKAVTEEIKATGKVDAAVNKPSAMSAVLEQQKAAQATLAAAREDALAAIANYDFKSNPPLAMARLISRTLRKPDGSLPSLEDSLVLALHWFETGLNPYRGDIYPLPSGRIGLSLQGEIKEAKREGHKFIPKYEFVTREWPTVDGKPDGKPIELVRKSRGVETKFSYPKEPGCKCILQIDGSEVEYTAWVTEWFMPTNPNWFERMHHMLMVRSFSNALSFSTGIGVSQEISTAESPSDTQQILTPKVTK